MNTAGVGGALVNKGDAKARHSVAPEKGQEEIVSFGELRQAQAAEAEAAKELEGVDHAAIVGESVEGAISSRKATGETGSKAAESVEASVLPGGEDTERAAVEGAKKEYEEALQSTRGKRYTIKGQQGRKIEDYVEPKKVTYAYISLFDRLMKSGPCKLVEGINFAKAKLYEDMDSEKDEVGNKKVA